MDGIKNFIEKNSVEIIDPLMNNSFQDKLKTYKRFQRAYDYFKKKEYRSEVLQLTLTINPNKYNIMDSYLNVREDITEILNMKSLDISKCFLIQEKHDNGYAHYHGFIEYNYYDKKTVDKTRGLLNKKIGRTKLIHCVKPKLQEELCKLRGVEHNKEYANWSDYIIKDITEENILHNWTRPYYYNCSDPIHFK